MSIQTLPPPPVYGTQPANPYPEEAKTPWYKSEFFITRPVKLEEIMNFSRQVSSFLRAGIPILDSLAVLLQPVEERPQRGQVTLDARLLERADVEEVADVVVDLGAVARGHGGAAAEELRGAREVELVRAHRVRRQLADRPAVSDERGRRLAELHAADVIRRGTLAATGVNEVCCRWERGAGNARLRGSGLHSAAG